MKRKIWFASCLMLLLVMRIQAQTGIYVSTGSSFYIAPSTTVSIDSLVFIPTAAYTITGANSQQRTNTILHPSLNPFIARVYRWEVNLPAFTGTLQFYYRESELNGLSGPGLTLNIHNGSSWVAYNPAARDATANFVTTSLTNVLINELTLADGLAPLPLTWLGITASRENDFTVIKWTTADEIDCKDYQVEKLSGAGTWNSLGTPVPARNTSGPNQYSRVDFVLLNGTAFYRVKQTDRNGKISYSSVVSVRNNIRELITLYPNPVISQVYVRSKGTAGMKTIRIYDAMGKLLTAITLNGSRQYIVQAAGLAAGNYIMTIELTDGSIQKKVFIKQ